MGEPSLGAPLTEAQPKDRLDSWKEIAVYLKRDVTTVQRWEKRERMFLPNFRVGDDSTTKPSQRMVAEVARIQVFSKSLYFFVLRGPAIQADFRMEPQMNHQYV
jgi:hypothetical protein